MPDQTLRLKYYQETGQTDLAKQYEQYLRETGQMPSGDNEPQPGIGTKILGTLAATGRDIPGVEAAQAFTRSAVRTGLHKILPESIAPDAESYREARDNIRGGEDAAPAVARNIARIGGGGLSAFAIPGGAMRQGFLYGAADALGQSDPDADLKSRIDQAGAEGVVGGALGAVGQTVGAVRKLPAGTIRKVGAALTPRPLQRAAKVLSVVRGAQNAAETAIPQAEGFVGNGMDNVLEAVKANGSEAPASDVLQAVKNGSGQSRPPILAPTRHRTNAQFEHFADQFAKRQAEQQATSGAEEDLTPLLQQSLEQIRKGGRLGSLARVP